MGGVTTPTGDGDTFIGMRGVLDRETGGVIVGGVVVGVADFIVELKVVKSPNMPIPEDTAWDWRPILLEEPVGGAISEEPVGGATVSPLNAENSPNSSDLLFAVNELHSSVVVVGVVRGLLLGDNRLSVGVAVGGLDRPLRTE